MAMGGSAESKWLHSVLIQFDHIFVFALRAPLSGDVPVVMLDQPIDGFQSRGDVIDTIWNSKDAIFSFYIPHALPQFEWFQLKPR